MKLDRIINESFDLDYEIIQKLNLSKNGKQNNELLLIFDQCDQQRKNFRIILIKLLKEKSVFDNFMGENDNTILSSKMKIHDELKDTIINNNLVKIVYLQNQIMEEKKFNEQLKKLKEENKLKLSNNLTSISKLIVEKSNNCNKNKGLNKSDRYSDTETTKITKNDKNKNTKISFNNHSIEETRKKNSISPFKETYRPKNESISIKKSVMKSVELKKSINVSSSYVSNKSNFSSKTDRIKDTNTNTNNNTNSNLSSKNTIVVSIPKGSINTIHNKAALKESKRNKINNLVSIKNSEKSKFNVENENLKGKRLSPIGLTIRKIKK